MRRSKQIDVRRALALAGAFSFLCSCAAGCLLPFLTLHLRQLGLSPSSTGIVMATKHAMTLVWRPVGAQLSKHYDKRRVVLTLSLLLSAAAALLLLLLPPSSAAAPGGACGASNLSTGSNHSVFAQPPTTGGPAVTASASDFLSRANSTSAPERNHTGPTLVQRENSSAASANISSVGRKRRSGARALGFLDSLKEMDAHSQLFFLTLMVVAVWEWASAPREWTADDGLYEYLDLADASDRHGGVAVWGLLGAACGAGGSGLLVSQLSCLIAPHTPRTAVHVLSYAGVAALALPSVAYLPLHLNRKRCGGLLKALQLLHGCPRALLCAVTVLLFGAASSAVDNFLLWQLQDLGGSELHMGASVALGLLSQAAFPLLAARFSRLLGEGRVLVAGAACFALQCFYYSFLWGPWAALLGQALSSFSSGALWWAVGVQCEDVATPGAERSVAKVFSLLCLQLGSVLGSLAGGLAAQRFGVPWLLRGAGLCLMAWCACLPLLQWKAPRQRRINYSRLLAADASEASDSESEPERDWLDKAMEDDRDNNNSDGRRSIYRK